MRPYLATAWVGARVIVQYRVMVLCMVLVSVVQVFVLARVWEAVYAGRGEVQGFSLRETIVYLTLANLQAAFLLSSRVSYIIAFRVRDGTVVFDVSRPVGFVGQMVAVSAGRAVVTLLFVALAAPLAFWAGGISAPASPTAALAYAVSLLLAWAINALVAVAVGLMAFWTMEIGGIDLLQLLVQQFLAGTAVPLVFFPGWLELVANLSPFRFVGYVPASIYVGRIEGWAVAGQLLLACGWVVVLAAGLALLWRRTYAKVVSQGG